MIEYDYRAGKKRVKDILNNKLEVLEKNRVPQDNEFTFTNAYYSYVTGIFIDIRDSSTLFSEEDKEKMAKIIRSFTSEVIEILRVDENLREIGIRGDCVYAIYTTPLRIDIFDLYQKCYYINTFMKMLNKLLNEKNYTQINVGIGISTSQELVIKAGRKDVGINSKVWIGEAVTKASNLSSLGSKNDINSIVLSEVTYDNVIEIIVNESGEKAKNWFEKKYHSQFGYYYHANIVAIGFSEWIDEGMLD